MPPPPPPPPLPRSCRRPNLTPRSARPARPARSDIKEEKYTNAFLGYGDEREHFALELTYNYAREAYDVGSGFGHFGLAVGDVRATAEAARAAGGAVTREPGPVKGGKTTIAFVKDPTGYPWELIERSGPIPEPIAQVMLRVTDLERSIKFYEEALGMRLLRTRENPEYKYTLAFSEWERWLEVPSFRCVTQCCGASVI